MKETQKISDRIKELKNAYKRAVKASVVPFEGKCHIKKIGEYYYLYNYVKKGETNDSLLKYVRKSSPEYKKLLNAEYCKRLLPVLEKEIDALERFSEEYDPDAKYGIITQFPESVRSSIDPLLCDMKTKMREWAEERYPSNGFPFDDSAVFLNEKGERFRSKAEYIIASVLNELGLFYRYECEYDACGRAYYPDFTVMHPESGELYYIEYFGMMSDIDYSESAFKKIASYQSGPDAAHFIYIFEAYNAPMNIEQVRNLLRTYFL